MPVRQASTRSWRIDGIDFRLDLAYKPSGILGRGSFGVVIAATDVTTLDGGTVAIKKIKPVARDEWDARHILREIKVMRILCQHPNIITLLDLDLDKNGDALYIVMELMDCDLHRVIHMSGQRLGREHIQVLLKQLLLALAAMHSRNIIHRDLKPQNILVLSDCQLRVTDFGLARTVRPPATEAAPAIAAAAAANASDAGSGGDGRVTPGMDAGDSGGDELASEDLPMMTEYVVTRWYRAPEVLLGVNGDYGAAIDLWATGCILGEMIAGKPLFAGRSHAHQVQLITDALGLPDIDGGLGGVGYRLGEDAVKFLRHLRQPPATAEIPSDDSSGDIQHSVKGEGSSEVQASCRKQAFPSAAASSLALPAGLMALLPEGAAVHAGPDAMELLSQLLRLHPARRPNAPAALQHSFLASAPPLPVDEHEENDPVEIAEAGSGSDDGPAASAAAAEVSFAFDDEGNKETLQSLLKEIEKEVKLFRSGQHLRPQSPSGASTPGGSAVGSSSALPRAASRNKSSLSLRDLMANASSPDTAGAAAAREAKTPKASAADSKGAGGAAWLPKRISSMANLAEGLAEADISGGEEGDITARKDSGARNDPVAAAAAAAAAAASEAAGVIGTATDAVRPAGAAADGHRDMAMHELPAATAAADAAGAAADATGAAATAAAAEAAAKAHNYSAEAVAAAAAVGKASAAAAAAGGSFGVLPAVNKLQYCGDVAVATASEKEAGALLQQITTDVTTLSSQTAVELSVIAADMAAGALVAALAAAVAQLAIRTAAAQAAAALAASRVPSVATFAAGAATTAEPGDAAVAQQVLAARPLLLAPNSGAIAGAIEAAEAACQPIAPAALPPARAGETAKNAATAEDAAPAAPAPTAAATVTDTLVPTAAADAVMAITVTVEGKPPAAATVTLPAQESLATGRPATASSASLAGGSSNDGYLEVLAMEAASSPPAAESPGAELLIPMSPAETAGRYSDDIFEDSRSLASEAGSLYGEKLGRASVNLKSISPVSDTPRNSAHRPDALMADAYAGEHAAAGTAKFEEATAMPNRIDSQPPHEEIEPGPAPAAAASTLQPPHEEIEPGPAPAAAAASRAAAASTAAAASMVAAASMASAASTAAAALTAAATSTATAGSMAVAVSAAARATAPAAATAAATASSRERVEEATAEEPLRKHLDVEERLEEEPKIPALAVDGMGFRELLAAGLSGAAPAVNTGGSGITIRLTPAAARRCAAISAAMTQAGAKSRSFEERGSAENTQGVPRQVPKRGRRAAG